jgi:hypothetical protein
MSKRLLPTTLTDEEFKAPMDEAKKVDAHLQKPPAR